MVTPMSARSYSESTDQEMDIWLKLTLSPSSSVIKTISFTVTPFLITCSGKHLGYRKCGKAGHCIREQFFCDGTVNCGVKNSVWPSGTSGHHCSGVVLSGSVVWCGVVWCGGVVWFGVVDLWTYGLISLYRLQVVYRLYTWLHKLYFNLGLFSSTFLFEAV